MTRYQNGIGLGLGHTGGNGADAGRGDQLDTDFCVRVDLFQVINQLRQIFNRIDVVMRRR